MKKIFDFSSKNGDKKFLIIITQSISVVIILISLVISISKYVSSIVKTESTSCKVVNAEKKVGRNCKSYIDICEAYEYYVYTYVYEVNGKEYTIDTKDSIKSPNCIVYYNKLNPTNNSFDKITFQDAFVNVLYTVLLCEIVSWLIFLIYIVRDKMKSKNKTKYNKK